MAEVLEGNLVGAGVRVAVAVARFNAIFSKQLLEGCLDALRRHGVAEGDVTVAWVPGSFELPLVARRLAETKRYDAVACLGAVIRGATPHFDLVCAEAAKGVAAASLSTGVPVAFGVVTCDTVEQAIDRCGAKAGNKGADAALAAIEMANLLKQLPK